MDTNSNYTINAGIPPVIGALIIGTMSTPACYSLGVCVSSTSIATLVKINSSGFAITFGIGGNQIYGKFSTPSPSYLFTCNLKIIY